MSEVPLYRAGTGRYRGTSLIRKRLPLRPCGRSVPRALR